LYFVNRSGDQFGPYSLSELQHYVAEGRLAMTDLAWTEGMPEWAFICDVIGNLRQPNSRSMTADTEAARLHHGLATRGEAHQAGDPLHERIRFGRGLFFVSLVGLSLVGGAFSASKETEALGGFIVIIGCIVIAVLRARDVGMSGWMALLAFVPIACFFLYYRLICAPRGYEITRRADTAMQVICWSFGGIVVLAILIAALSSATR
jgi:uncharacterized membrane protein YhaH (DUF805 family)